MDALSKTDKEGQDSWCCLIYALGLLSHSEEPGFLNIPNSTVQQLYERYLLNYSSTDDTWDTCKTGLLHGDVEKFARCVVKETFPNYHYAYDKLDENVFKIILVTLLPHLTSSAFAIETEKHVDHGRIDVALLLRSDARTSDSSFRDMVIELKYLPLNRLFPQPTIAQLRQEDHTQIRQKYRCRTFNQNHSISFEDYEKQAADQAIRYANALKLRHGASSFRPRVWTMTCLSWGAILTKEVPYS